MLLWLVLALAHVLGAQKIQDDRNVTIHVIQITSCPDVGYFFKRVDGINSLRSCHLCFCQNDGTAVCWERHNKRCDVSSYQHNSIRKRETRIRRSPLGLGDIFFRDAARDIFKKNPPENCKPYESSFSDGCPPDDWCVGCTVCDCDANGRWDCHVLSFCPDKDSKKLVTPNKKIKRIINKQKSMTKVHYNKAKENIMKSIKLPIPDKFKKKQISPVKNAKNEKKRSIEKYYKTSPTPMIKGKRKSPLNLKTTRMKFNQTDKEKITQEVIKRVMAMVKRLLSEGKMIKQQVLKSPPCQKVDKPSRRKPDVNSILKKHKPVSSEKKQYKKYNQQKIVRLGDKTKTKKQKNIPNSVKQSNPRYRKVKKIVRQRRHVNFHDIAIDDNVTVTLLKKQNETLKDSNMKIFEHTNGIQKLHNDTKQFDSVLNYGNRDKIKHNEFIFMLYNFNKTRVKSNTSLHHNIDGYDQIISNKAIPLKNSSHFDIHETIKKYRQNIMFKRLYNKYISAYQFILKYIYNTSGRNSTTGKEEALKNNINIGIVQKFESQLTDSSSNINTIKNIVNNSIENRKNEKKQSLNIQYVRHIFDRIFSQFRKNNTALTTKRRKFNLIKYIRKMIRKAFRRQTNIRTNHNKEIVQAICDIVKKCGKKQIRNKSLDLKINELKMQTHIILKSINIIKGLLHFISIPESANDNSELNRDVHKLNHILRGQYGKPLTNSEKIQIDYVKSNSKTFIEAIGNFANILRAIIKILTEQSETNKQEARKLNQDFIQRKENISLSQEVHDLQFLLVKYNLIQNNVMKKMYETLKKFDRTQINKIESKVSLNNYKQNTSIAIARISKEIVKNLRKLKNLAETMNFSIRRKRNIRQSNNVEFLLNLMEYLIYENSHLAAAPEKDGIDLLIEAIRDAPDVKLAQKSIHSNSKKTIETSQTSFNSGILDNSNIYNENNNSMNTGEYKDIEQITTLLYDDSEHYGRDIFNGLAMYQMKYTTTPSTFVESTLQAMRNDSMNYIDITNNNMLNNFLSEENTKRLQKLDVSEGVKSSENVKSEVVEASTIITTDMIKTTPSLMHITLDWLDESYDQNDNEKNVTKSVNVTNISSPRSLKSRNKPMPQKQADTVSSITKEEIEAYDKRRLEKNYAGKILHKKREMNLLNSLDHGTDQSELSDSIDDKEAAYIYY
ncbi:hypothetical protein ACJJTC_013613 [Scirpophaga incertulas]